MALAARFADLDELALEAGRRACWQSQRHGQTTATPRGQFADAIKRLTKTARS
jgi:hypothetical protein